MAFARAGHIVYGQTRSERSKTALAKDEIIPLAFDQTTKEGLKPFIDAAKGVDVGESPPSLFPCCGPTGMRSLMQPVIDTIPFESAEGPLALFDAFTHAVQHRPPGAKAAYIYCGGSWTMSRGDGGLDNWTDERQANSGRVQLTKWRSEVESKVLSSASTGQQTTSCCLT